MKANPDAAMDSLARFIEVIGTDAELREHFCELAKLSPVQRSNHIHVMAERMALARKDPDLVTVFRLFADARIFDAALVALRESR